MTRDQGRTTWIGAMLAAAIIGLLAPGIDAQATDDPGAVMATWAIGGQNRSITVGEFESTQKLLEALEGTAQRGVTAERVWEFVLSKSEADAFGIVVTDAELADKLQKNDPDIHEGVIRRWAAQGVSVEDGESYTRAAIAFDKLRDFLLNTQRITTRDAFDHFKQNHLRFKIDYLMFAAEDFESEVDEAQLDEGALRAYWNENKQIPAMFREPATVSAEFVYLDPSSFTMARAREAAGGREVSREEALAYFKANRKELMPLVPADKKHLLEFDADTPLDQVKTPFDVLRETIEKQLLLETLLRGAHEEARKGAELTALAEKYNLGHEKMDAVDRAQATTSMRKFGFSTFAQLFAAEPGAVSSEIASQSQVRYFFKLLEKTDSRLPDFEEVKGELRRHYLSTKSAELAKRAAQRVIQIMNDRAELDVEDQRAELETRAEELAERRIAELGMTRPTDRNRELARARAEVRRQVESDKKKMLPAYFEDYLKESGKTPEQTGFFEFQPIRMDRSGDTDIDASRKVFLESNYYVRSLEIGDVAPILLEDHVTKAYFIVRLADKRDPEFESMGPVDLHQARAQLAQIREMEFMRRWRYPILRERLGLKETN